jgi:hypothetical protein
MGIGLRSRPLGPINLLLRSIAKGLLNDTIFKAVKGDDSKSSAWFQKIRRHLQKTAELSQFVIHLHPKRLKDLRRRMSATSATQ